MIDGRRGIYCAHYLSLPGFCYLFDLLGRIVQYVYNNKNIVRTDVIYNKYHMYILSKKPRITHKVDKYIYLYS